jgi:hypothetical protein
MSDDKVHVVSADQRQLRDTTNRWRIFAVASIVVLFTVLRLAPTLRSGEEPQRNPTEALPAATTTTSAQTSGEQPTTTTTEVGHVMRDLANAIAPDIRAFCERASPVGLAGHKDVDVWTDSVNNTEFRAIEVQVLVGLASEVDAVRNTLNVQQISFLNSIQNNLIAAEDALQDALQAIEAEQAADWLYHVVRIERFCGRVTASVTAMAVLSTD